MASVFNYFNTTKKTDCRRDRCPGHEGGIIMTSGGEAVPASQREGGPQCLWGVPLEKESALGMHTPQVPRGYICASQLVTPPTFTPTLKWGHDALLPEGKRKENRPPAYSLPLFHSSLQYDTLDGHLDCFQFEYCKQNYKWMFLHMSLVHMFSFTECGIPGW